MTGDSLDVPSTVGRKVGVTGASQTVKTKSSASEYGSDSSEEEHPAAKRVHTTGLVPLGNDRGRTLPAKPLRRPLADPNFEERLPVVDWPSVQFLEAKAGLKYKAAAQVTRLGGKRGMISTLKRRRKRLEEQLRLFRHAFP